MQGGNEATALIADYNGAGASAKTHPSTMLPAALRARSYHPWQRRGAGPRRAPGSEHGAPPASAASEPGPGTSLLAPPWSSRPGTARQRKSRGSEHRVRRVRAPAGKWFRRAKPRKRALHAKCSTP